MSSRALALILVAIGAQLGAGEVAAATADDAASPSNPGEPSVTQQLAGEEATTPGPAADPAAATASAATAVPASPSAASSSVTISRAKASRTRSVSIVDFAFDPTAMSVKLGDTVQWINNGTADEGHNMIGDGLASPVLHTGESYRFTFTAAGTYDYICTIHPKMTGTVEVIDPNADEPTPKNESGGKRGNASAGTSASGDGSSGSPRASSSATGPSSESAAVGSRDAAGTSGSLPSTGSRSVSLALAGLSLLALGLALRSVGARRLGRRS